jgi:Zn-dependent peptidase ImmA (M78 family)
MVDLARRAAGKAAENFLNEQGITNLPVMPIILAEAQGIKVIEKPGIEGGVSGMLIKANNQFIIAYATHIQNEGFRRFSIGHELGHYLLPGHSDALLPIGQSTHASRAGYRSDDRYEREADHFSARLLMPNPLFSKAMRSAGDGLEAIISLSALCSTSLLATANRYVEETSLPMAMVVSTGQRIDYTFLSDELLEYRDISYSKKGSQLPIVPTAVFNRDIDKVTNSHRETYSTDMRDWFGGKRSISMIEEIIGLGNYSRTLTILSAQDFADDDDENEELKQRWTPKFR